MYGRLNLHFRRGTTKYYELRAGLDAIPTPLHLYVFINRYPPNKACPHPTRLPTLKKRRLIWKEKR